MRLSSMEAELTQLKPLLLMQPYPLQNTTVLSPQDTITSQATASKAKPGKKKTNDRVSPVPEEGNALKPEQKPHNRDVNYYSNIMDLYPWNRRTPASHKQVPTTQASTSLSIPNRNERASTSASVHDRHPRSIKAGKMNGHSTPLLPLTADARTEHLLLAARKIGRERASIVAGIMRQADREKEKLAQEQEQQRLIQESERLERERLERLANGKGGISYYRRDTVDLGVSPGTVAAQPPRTPKRGIGVGGSHYPITALGGGRTIANSSSTFTGSPGPRAEEDDVLTTPRQAGTSQPGQSQSQSQAKNPPTPLDSLLSAARSMMDDASGKNRTTNGNLRRRSSVIEHPESPLPKRRRVVGTGRSALDVLADQAAAAFPESDQGPTQGSKIVKGKGKAKETEPRSGAAGRSTNAASKGKGRAREKLNSQPEPSTRKSRPRAPPRDRNALSSTTLKAKTKDPPNSPAPRIISLPQSRLIAPGARLGVSPLDEALLPVTSRTKDKDTRHSPRAPPELTLEPPRGYAGMSLRPVVGWGARGRGVEADVEGDTEMDTSSPVRDHGPTQRRNEGDLEGVQGENSTEHAERVTEKTNGGADELGILSQVDDNNSPQHAESIQNTVNISYRMVNNEVETTGIETAEPTCALAQLSGHAKEVVDTHITSEIEQELPHTNPSPMMRHSDQGPSLYGDTTVAAAGSNSEGDIDAEAEDDDPDAEGEKDDDKDPELDTDNQNQFAPSHIPPLPALPPGPNDSPPDELDDDQDADADAEGEMESETEEPLSVVPSLQALEPSTMDFHSPVGKINFFLFSQFASLLLTAPSHAPPID